MKNTFLTKTDLAQAYFPYIDPRSARQKLMGIITDDNKLITQLEDAGYLQKNRHFSPLQVEIIMQRLGNPWK